MIEVSDFIRWYVCTSKYAKMWQNKQLSFWKWIEISHKRLFKWSLTTFAFSNDSETGQKDRQDFSVTCIEIKEKLEKMYAYDKRR